MSWWRKIFPEYVKPADIVIELKYDPSNKHYRYAVGYHTNSSAYGYDYKCVHTGDDYDEALAKYNEVWDNFERVGKKVADKNGLRVGTKVTEGILPPIPDGAIESANWGER